MKKALFEKGIYSLPDASRYTRIPAGQLRRWAFGYERNLVGGIKRYPPVFATSYGPINNERAISFGDLIEARFIREFREAGVSLQTIRIAVKRAQELLELSHPFSTRKFKTDGRTIMAEIITARDAPCELLDFRNNQMALNRILSPYLFNGIEFNDGDIACRWWPHGEGNAVVLDPRRSFGQSILNDSGVPTNTLFLSFKANGSAQAVARIFELPLRQVEEAIEYERELAA